MSKYLVTTVETWRVDSEGEVASFIEEAKSDPKFELAKYQSEKKDVKSKGEVVDSFYKVTLTKSFNDIKEPDSDVKIVYTKEAISQSEDETSRNEDGEVAPW